MKINHICFILEGYPTSNDPVFTFVRELIVAIADEGIKCSVIAPQSITNSMIRRRDRRPTHWVDVTEKKNKIDVYQPSYISLSNIKLKGSSVTYKKWKKTIINTFRKLNINPDVLYGHFWHSGHVASVIGKEKNIPVFVASGESIINVYNLFRKSTVQKYLPYVKGIISVSTKNKLESVELNLTTKEKVEVIPNAINAEIFYQKNKKTIRKKLGFNEEDFIVAFTGTFNERKGVLRLAEAVKEVGNIKTIFIGSGNLKPDIDGILFSGRLPHNEIPDYLNAADVFVLPTLAEGCSNAIIEAMACGLPIISSDLSFNDDILKKQNSIRIDSNNIEVIADAIRYMKENPFERKKMSNVSLKIANELDIKVRAKKILEYILKQSRLN